jgi:sugar phosphate isomerase/epimerase
VRRTLFVLLLASIAVMAHPPADAATTIPIGFCGRLNDLERAKQAGFDYVELGTTEIAALSDADFDEAAARVRRIALPTPVTNLFLPAALKVTGPDVDAGAQTRYVAAALTRLARLGVTTVVFGSGGARRVPDGYSKEAAWRQLVDFSRRAAQAAQPHGITIAIEPLRRQETNIVNSAAEGLDLVNAVAHPNFQLMIDFYHLASEHEDPAIVLRARDHIVHLHMANPQGRVFPLAWSEYDYAPFFANLRAIGYGRRISVEASTQDFGAEAPRAISLLRQAFR